MLYTVQEYRLANSLEEAWTLLQKNRRNVILGGGMWLRTGRASFQTVIDLSGLGLEGIRQKDGYIVLGSMTTLRQLETSPLLKGLYGGVILEAVAPIVGVQFRNTATLGGSICGRFGFSDVITVLLALDAEVELYRAGRMSLADFLAADRTKRDILTAVRIPMDGRTAVYQTRRNTVTDFGVLNVCLARTPDGRHALSIGARPGVAVRCPAAEAALDAGDMDAALDAAAALHFSSNLRGSADYRAALARVLTRRAMEAMKEGV